jgi:hypothetical protein
MTWDEDQQPAPEPTDRYTGDRFANRGQDLIREAALAALEQHKSLPPREAENFAAKFASGTSKLAAQQEERLVSLAQVPLTMPEPLVDPNL